MPRFIIVFVLIALFLTACAPDPRDTAYTPASRQPSPTMMRWGYYPGYGCVARSFVELGLLDKERAGRSS
jgi:hypothetical protein